MLVSSFSFTYNCLFVCLRGNLSDVFYKRKLFACLFFLLSYKVI